MALGRCADPGFCSGISRPSSSRQVQFQASMQHQDFKRKNCGEDPARQIRPFRRLKTQCARQAQIDYVSDSIGFNLSLSTPMCEERNMDYVEIPSSKFIASSISWTWRARFRWITRLAGSPRCPAIVLALCLAPCEERWSVFWPCGHQPTLLGHRNGSPTFIRHSMLTLVEAWSKSVKPSDRNGVSRRFSACVWTGMDGRSVRRQVMISCVSLGHCTGTFRGCRWIRFCAS